MEHKLGTIKVQAELKENPSNKIESFRDITEKYKHLSKKQKEHVYAVFLDNSNEEIGDKLLGLGGRDQTQFDIQDLVRTAALVNAAAVILVHNHPSGNPEPTEQDKDVTKEIADALEIIGVQLLDHAIISQNQNYSMKRQQNRPFQR